MSRTMNHNRTMIDIVDPIEIEIHISDDGTKLWINDELKCLFRAYGIKRLILNDDRKS